MSSILGQKNLAVTQLLIVVQSSQEDNGAPARFQPDEIGARVPLFVSSSGLQFPAIQPGAQT